MKGYKVHKVSHYSILFLPLMFSSNSSGFDKELAATRAYDLEDPLGESAIEVVQAIDEFDLEQSCLIRLKAQRQKIEELTKLYLEKEKELSNRLEQEKKLQEEVERLSDLSEYKQSFTSLKRDYDVLLKKDQNTAEEFESLREEFDQTIQAFEEEQQSLRADIKLQKEQRLLAEANWEAIVADREEELKKQNRLAQEKEAALVDKINRLQEELDQLKEIMDEKGIQLQSTSFSLKGQLKVKQEEILNYDKLVECMRRQLSDYKKKIVGSENEWEREKDELCEMVDQLKTQMRLMRKDQGEKETQIYQYKEMIRRCDIKNQTLEETVSSLKANLKKMKESMGTSIKQLTSSSEEEKSKLEILVQELRNKKENDLEEKGTLALEVKRLRGLLERREQQEKQRKILLMNQFREIDKMERVVKKII